MQYFLHLSYDGSNYHGWQRQKRVISVQEQIESTLSKVLGKEVGIRGCGRTDAGVHASQYFASFRSNHQLPTNFVFILNKNLPLDIRVFDCIDVSEDAHAQFDPEFRTYRYYWHFSGHPMLERFSTEWEFSKPDTAKMNEALTILYGEVDLRSFCKQPNKHNHTRVIFYHTHLALSQDERLLCLELKANRFLKASVRALAHFLQQVGLDKISSGDFHQAVLDAREADNLRMAPARGLHLVHLSYPYITKEPQDLMQSFFKR